MNRTLIGLAIALVLASASFVSAVEQVSNTSHKISHEDLAKVQILFNKNNLNLSDFQIIKYDKEVSPVQREFVRANRLYKGLVIFLEGDVIYQFNKEGVKTYESGLTSKITKEISLESTISKEEAVNKAIEESERQTSFPELNRFDEGNMIAELGIANKKVGSEYENPNWVLAWKITNGGSDYPVAFVDANDGTIIYYDSGIYTGSSENNQAGCHNYYWFDNTNKECSQKQFCGAFMYYGLQTFETKGECESALNENAAGGPISTHCPQITTKEVCNDYGAGICLWDEQTNSCIGRTERNIISCEKDSDCRISNLKDNYCFNSSYGEGSGTNLMPSSKKADYCTCENNLCVGHRNECTQDSDCEYAWFTGGCHTPEYVRKVLEDARKNGTLIGEDWSGRDKNLTCSCVNNKCVVQNQTFILSNGRKAEIKIMPETASARAKERLGELGFNVQLKEVGNNKVVYELTAEKEGRMLGLFKVKGKFSAQVDAETGNIISVKKPWWSFMATGI
jgi:hypothetical protein